MEFRFIDNNTPLDRRSQKLVRHHAMKGKNLGRTLPARGHRGRQTEDVASTAPTRMRIEPQRFEKPGNGRKLLPKVARIGPEPAAAETWQTDLPVNPFCGAELSFFAIPVRLTPAIRWLFYEIHRSVSEELYPRVFCRWSNKTETSWFECVIENPSVLHCALAMTGANKSRVPGHRDEPLESTRHFSQATRLLRQDLGTTPEPQYSSVAVVISLAIHANLTGAVNESSIHLRGLKSILELRPGGLAELCSSTPELGNKIRRADLELALRAGTPTIFGSQPSPQPVTPHVIAALDGRSPSVDLPYPLGETSVAVQSAIRDTLALSSCAGRGQLGSFQYQDIVISIFQRLADYAPLGGPRPPRLLDDVCQLGLLTFMSTVLYHGRRRQSAYPTLISELLWTRLIEFDDDMAQSRITQYPSFHLWLIFVYGLSAPVHDQCCDSNSPVTRRIRALASVLALRRWDDVTAHLRVYSWITAFHDERGKRVWESTMYS